MLSVYQHLIQMICIPAVSVLKIKEKTRYHKLNCRFPIDAFTRLSGRRVLLFAFASTDAPISYQPSLVEIHAIHFGSFMTLGPIQQFLIKKYFLRQNGPFRNETLIISCCRKKLPSVWKQRCRNHDAYCLLPFI